MGERDAVQEMECDRPEEPDFLPGRLRSRGDKETERAADRERGADDEFADLIGLAVMLSVPAIEDRNQGEKADANDGVEGDEPRGRQRFAHEDQIELPVAPN